MTKKIIITLSTLILVILPFMVGVSIGKYSPYVEANSFRTYVLIWAVVSIVLASTVLLLLNYFHQSFNKTVVAGIFLFLLLCPIFGIVGLVAPPDLSIKMLEHPEREHLRYSFLFIAAILFGTFFFLLLKGNSFKVKDSTKWIMVVFAALAFVEFIWEFTHHYSYPEGLKEWINQGKNAEEFVKNYDNSTMITIGAIGRYIQYLLIIWLSLQLYKLKQIKIWNPIVMTIFGLLGIVSATVIYVTQFNIPKGFEILLFFFIPGFPFLLLYWLGVALLTKFKKSEIGD
ncbi:MAG: hypothetical protein ACOYN4_08610 [Bacteroidales bacterium]